MDWKILLVIVILVVVAGVIATLGVLFAKANVRVARAEAERKERENEIKRLVNERENKKLTDKEVADELSKMLDRWSPTSPGSGVGGAGTG